MSRCKICRADYSKRSISHKCCSPDCAQALAVKIREKAAHTEAVKDRREHKVKRENIKPLSYWAKKAQTAVNAWIRERDKAEPCISCGRFHAGQYHAGHYLSVGAHPELRFNPDNIHKQCAPCNNHLSGNITAMRPRLLDKIGPVRLAELEGPHPAAKYTREEFKLIENEHRAKLKLITTETI